MKLIEFLKKSEEKSFLDSFCIINFIGPAQPAVLFFQSLLGRLKEVGERPLVLCDLHLQTSAEIQAQLATSFLGSAFIYSIVVSSESVKQSASLLAYLESYKGVHLVVVATQQEQALRERADILHVFLDETVDYTLYNSLQAFLQLDQNADLRFTQELFRRSPTVPLDMACMLMQYQLFLGKNNKPFFATWFDRIVEQKQSLFLLSQYLFARDVQRFYDALSPVAQEYPAEFWIAFWSEQLWQALIFVTIAKTDGPLIAKKSVSRLPFAFMQKDWHKHSVAQLTTAHDLLYQIDYANKNGSVTEGLDLWYAKFLI